MSRVAAVYFSTLAGIASKQGKHALAASLYIAAQNSALNAERLDKGRQQKAKWEPKSGRPGNPEQDEGDVEDY
jgi:hypothetical protein